VSGVSAPSMYVGIIVSLAGDVQINAEGNLTAGLIDIGNLRQATATADIRITPFGPQTGTFSAGSSQYFTTGTCGNLCEMTLFLPFVGNDEVLNMSLSAQAIGENAAALFMDTAKVVSVGIYDGINGNLVPGATFTWGSGATYPLADVTAPPTAVPEPATMLLVGGGLVVGFIRRRHRPGVDSPSHYAERECPCGPIRNTSSRFSTAGSGTRARTAGTTGATMSMR
jgi:PEP-CTERM motif